MFVVFNCCIELKPTPALHTVDKKDNKGESKPERIYTNSHIDLAELFVQSIASFRTELLNLIERRQDKLVKEL
jgi:hypothetical protein